MQIGDFEILNKLRIRFLVNIWSTNWKKYPPYPWVSQKRKRDL